MPSLGRLVSESGEKSIRDVISHYRFVDAGALNINKNWSGIFGGPENLNNRPSMVPRQLLIEPVDRLCADVQRTVDRVLGALLTEVTAE